MFAVGLFSVAPVYSDEYLDGVSPSVFRCNSMCHGSATRYRSEMEMQVS